MHSSWNQWSGSVAPPVPSYGATYPQSAVPPAGAYPQFQVNAATPVTTPAVASAYQTSLYGQTQQPPQQPPQTPQQWQQWEQWQQQYAQWHQQYGDKYQGPLPTGMLPPGMPTMSNTYPSIPPLPPGAPTAQPPPPDSVPPPPSTDKTDTDPGKRASQDAGKEETKKQKTGKGKAETVEDLMEQEKTFDEQFKSWETSFMKWKEQNANHPDKTQYKEFETKWENLREQLIQKRELLRKKREAKEAEVAAAAAAAREVALATNTKSAGYSTATAVATQSTPYMPSNMIYPMAGMYPTQDMSQLASQAQSYMPNYPVYNMPPPTNMPPMPLMTSMTGLDQQNKMDASKNNQSLEFLSSSTATKSSIPGLDLVGSDKSSSATAPVASNIPQSSTLFSSYNQDVTKPLHTSDDKPFNFPTLQQSNNYNYNDQSRNQYSSFQLSRPPPALPDNQFQQTNPYDQRTDSNDFMGGDRQRFDDKFDNRPGPNLQGDNNYRQPPDSRNDSLLDKGSKFGGGTTYTPNFNSEKYAKYYEDEYDDSRFRDPEPPESPQRNNKFNNYGRNERDNFSNFRPNNFGNRGGLSYKFDDVKRDFNDMNNRKEMERGRGRAHFGDRNKPDGPNSFNNRYRGFGRGQAGDTRSNFNSWQNNEFKGPPERFDNAEFDKSDSGKPMSLLDLPMMKPPDTFDKKPFDDKASGPFGNDKGPDGGIPRNNADNSRLGVNVPPPMRGPPFGDTDNSQLGSKQPNSQLDGPKNKLAPDSNKFPTQGMLNQPKPPQNAAAPRKDGPAGDNKAAAADEVEVDLIPSMVFDYEHYKKTSAETLPSAFDAVYIFDYAHGKKKTDNKNFIDSLASEVKASSTWETVSWNGDKKPNSEEPLPQRVKPATDLTKELAAILNKTDSKSDNKPKEAKSEAVTEKKPTGAPWLRETVADIPAKLDEPVAAPAPTTTPAAATSAATAAKPTVPENKLLQPNSKLIDDLLLPPGRHSRPIKLVVIMRGPPGSGKTFTAKLIKDKEVEMGGSAPRILSLDDYFTVENDVETTDPSTGKKTTKKEMVYEYEAELEPSYQDSLVKSFKKTISDGFFPFIIIDCINDKVKKYEEMYSFALSKGFQVFVCEMDSDLGVCSKRNIHNRTEDEIKRMIDGWEKTPPSQTTLDIRSLLQSAAITEVDMVDVEEEPAKEAEPPKKDETTEQPKDEKEKPVAAEEKDDEQETPMEEESEKAEQEEFSSYMDILCTSKWDSENTEEKLDRLDGVSKKRSSTTFKEWLQLPEDETDLSWYAPNDKAAAASTEANANVPRKKRVRWADLEERVAQQKMRAIGFVVGQTDWNRMMDPSFGGSKLTQTKYIYK